MTAFSELGIALNLIQSIQEMGYESPTVIQEKAIPALIEADRDVVALAQTGTGKTAAFGLPLLSLVDSSNRDTQALIMAPTRELAVQIAEELRSFAKYDKQLSIVTVYGGADIMGQMKSIKRGASIIVATPGRLNDLIKRKVINLRSLQYVVLDEADEMLNMGFKEEIDFALSTTPEDKLVWLFSATMAGEVRRIAETYMDNPLEITSGQKNAVNQNITHQLIKVGSQKKYETLKWIILSNMDLFGVLFCRTKAETNTLAERLVKDGFNVGALNGDLSQNQRDRVMSRFRNREIELLIATDVAARGIDVNDITHVIHYNIPDEIEFFTHRSGRTARAGKQGVSILISSGRDGRRLDELSRRLKIKFEEVEAPRADQLMEIQAQKWAKSILKVEPSGKTIDQLAAFAQQELDFLSKEELIKRLLFQSFGAAMNAPEPSRDRERGDRGDRRGRGDDSRGGRSRREGRSDRSSRGQTERGSRSYETLRINMGKRDGISKKELLDLVVEVSRVHPKSIGDIKLKNNETFFDVENDKSSKVKKGFEGAEIGGRSISVDEKGSSDQPSRNRPGRRRNR